MAKINLDSIQFQKLIDWVKFYLINQEVEHVEKIVHQALSLEKLPSFEEDLGFLTFAQAVDDFYESDADSHKEKKAVMRCIHLAIKEDDLVILFDQVLSVYLTYKKKRDDNFELKLGIRKVAQLLK